MHTSIIATIGPSSIDRSIMRSMILAGAEYFRINTAYSNEQQIATILSAIEKITDAPHPHVLYDIRASDAGFVPTDAEYIALSFSETKEQIAETQKRFPKAKIIAKIETTNSIDQFDELLNASWGIMIARGDLGKAVQLEHVPCLQKRLAKQTLATGKFLVVATEMLLSMQDSESPTRAEVSDVANAVFENASAVMLSEETAIGKHPVEAVSYMKRIIDAALACPIN